MAIDGNDRRQPKSDKSAQESERLKSERIRWETARTVRTLIDLNNSKWLNVIPRRLRLWGQAAILRRSGLFDAAWYLRTYRDVADAGVDPLRHYIESGIKEGRRPNESPAWAEAALNKKEGRIERNIPGLSRPVELGILKDLEYLTRPINVRIVDGTSNKCRYLIFVPHYFQEILFGGYLAFFEFVRGLQRESNCELELVIVREVPDPSFLEDNLARMRQHQPKIASLFSKVHYLPDIDELEIVGRPGVVSYCAETHYVACDVAQKIGVLPIFFIQEYEPDFHAAGSLKTFVRGAFELPHIGVYNSTILCEYFRQHSGVVRVREPGYRCVAFENPIKPMPWTLEQFRASHATKPTKHLIVYGRPEPHGARNEFAIIVLALKRTLKLGYLDHREWSFVSIGSLVTEDEIELSKDSKLKIVTKLPYSEYEQFLLLGDVGISLISTPHPGIVHFQMASFGLITITNTTELRTPEWLRGQSANLLPIQLTVEALSKALKSASALADDLETRHRQAVESILPRGDGGLGAAIKFALDAGKHGANRLV
jgi:hypothetical protein